MDQILDKFDYGIENGHIISGIINIFFFLNKIKVNFIN